jgi:nitrate reductase NapE component
MKIDETKLPEGKDGMVRCPHCREILRIDEESLSLRPLASDSRPQEEPLDTNESVAPQADEQEFTSYDVPPNHDTKTSIDEDSSDDFLFPAEMGPDPLKEKKRSLKLKLVLWVIISVALIGFFALLVNLILPGPPEPGKVPVVYSKKKQATGVKSPRSSSPSRAPEAGRVPMSR